MTDVKTDWRVIDGVATAWFEVSSLVEGAALAERIIEAEAEVAVDLRSTGVRVGVSSAEQAQVVSAVARDLGLVTDPSVLQRVSVVLESTQPDEVREFWRRTLDYTSGAGGLEDPLRRDPALRLRSSDGVRPLRNRIHLDVVRPAAVVEQLGLGEGSGPYGVCHADADGNEVDLVPGGALGDGAADWRVVFAAMVCYRVATPVQQRDLVLTAARLADQAGFPLLIDVRPGLVILDSGKDMADADAHGLDLDFADLAAGIQAAAHELEAHADAALPRFVQLFLDAADVDAVRAFWRAALGYVPDRRDGVSDIVDPRRLNPELVFQKLVETDTERRGQRNRIHVELALPADAAEARVAAALAAGGSVPGFEGEDESGGRRWCVLGWVAQLEAVQGGGEDAGPGAEAGIDEAIGGEGVGEPGVEPGASHGHAQDERGAAAHPEEIGGAHRVRQSVGGERAQIELVGVEAELGEGGDLALDVRAAAGLVAGVQGIHHDPAAALARDERGELARMVAELIAGQVGAHASHHGMCAACGATGLSRDPLRWGRPGAEEVRHGRPR